MKKNLLIMITASLVFVFWTGGCSDDPDVQPENTAFNARTLGIVPGSTIAELMFNWYSKAGDGDRAFVRIFDAGGRVIKTWEGTSGPATEGNRWHKVTVGELAPNTVYGYAVSVDSVKWSDKYSIRTASGTNSFVFAAVGDPQLAKGEQTEGWRETVRAIAGKDASLIASVGDHIDFIFSHDDESEWEAFFAPKELRSIPLAPVMGNHDAYVEEARGSFSHHFSWPNNVRDGKADVIANYYYLYNNVLFVALNTSEYVNSVSNAREYINLFDETITKAKAAFSEYDWLIVKHHKSLHSVAAHSANPDAQYFVEAGFEGLMDKHGVDIVLAGHDHVYARSHVMKGGDIAVRGAAELPGGLGTVYMTLTSSSGQKYYNAFMPCDSMFYHHMIRLMPDRFSDREEGCNTQFPLLADGTLGTQNYSEHGVLPMSTYTWKQDFEPGYVIITVEGKRINVEAYLAADGGRIIDSFRIAK